MKAVFLIQDISTHGGTERTTCCLANEMTRHRWDVSVLSCFAAEGCNAAYELHNDVKCVFLSEEKYGIHLGLAKRAARTIQRIPELKRNKDLQEADIIIGQKTMATLLLWLSGYRKKTVACEHFRYKMYNGFVRMVRNLMYSRMKHLVVLTDKDANIYRSHGVKHVTVIPNMVSITPLPYEGENSKTIISVGRLERQKGYDLLVESVAMISDKMGDYHVDIYGDGSEKSALEKKIKTLGLENRIYLRGYIKDIMLAYSHASFYVMSSRFEGFPMVLLEAAAAGLPIVSFKCPEGPEQLLKTGGGLLVESESTEAMSDALLRMISDNSLREQLRNMLPQVVAPYSPENIFCLWNSLVDKIV